MYGTAHETEFAWPTRERADKGPTRWDYEQLLELTAAVAKSSDRTTRIRTALERLALLLDASCVMVTRHEVGVAGLGQVSFDVLCRPPKGDAFEYVSIDAKAGAAAWADVAVRFGWSVGPYFQERVRPFGVDMVLMSRSRTQEGPTDIGCAAYREAEEPGARRRERELHRLFGHAAAPLLFPPHPPVTASATPAVDFPHLPQRFRPVLNGLLAGEAPKQIARKHGLSLHTTYEYTKQLYRRLNVSGRGELLALFVRR